MVGGCNIHLATIFVQPDDYGWTTMGGQKKYWNDADFADRCQKL
jgi:hypothetical protein